MTVKLENGMERLFRKGDIVVPVRGEDKGKIGMITQFNSEIQTSSVQVTFWEQPVRISVDTQRSLYHSTSEIAHYQNPHRLIRPLAVGDSVVIAQEMVVFFTYYNTLHKGKVMEIQFIRDLTLGVPITTYQMAGLTWVIENIDIPATNRLLMRKYGLPNRKNTFPMI